MDMNESAAADPAIGVWKLNVAKSTFALAPAPKSSVMKIEACEDGLKVNTNTIDSDGNKLHAETVHRMDGRYYSLTGSPLADSVSSSRINERRGESVLKRLGNVVVATKTIISWDGKTLAVMRTGMDRQGRMADELLVYERQ